MPFIPTLDQDENEMVVDREYQEHMDEMSQEENNYLEEKTL